MYLILYIVMIPSKFDRIILWYQYDSLSSFFINTGGTFVSLIMVLRLRLYYDDLYPCNIFWRILPIFWKYFKIVKYKRIINVTVLLL